MPAIGQPAQDASESKCARAHARIRRASGARRDPPGGEPVYSRRISGDPFNEALTCSGVRSDVSVLTLTISCFSNGTRRRR